MHSNITIFWQYFPKEILSGCMSTKILQQRQHQIENCYSFKRAETKGREVLNAELEELLQNNPSKHRRECFPHSPRELVTRVCEGRREREQGIRWGQLVTGCRAAVWIGDYHGYLKQGELEKLCLALALSLATFMNLGETLDLNQKAQ